MDNILVGICINRPNFVWIWEKLILIKVMIYGREFSNQNAIKWPLILLEVQYHKCFNVSFIILKWKCVVCIGGSYLTYCVACGTANYLIKLNLTIWIVTFYVPPSFWHKRPKLDPKSPLHKRLINAIQKTQLLITRMKINIVNLMSSCAT